MLEEYLTKLVRLYKMNGLTQQSLAGFILEHGRFFGADAKSFKGRRMTPKQCFCNATKVVLRDPSMTYVEGYVMTVIPIHHVWVRAPTARCSTRHYAPTMTRKASLARRSISAFRSRAST